MSINRDDILETAAQIFRKKGYHATSMQDIAEAVSLQKASLYHHVTSKQEILLALLDKALDILIECLTPVIKKEVSTEEKLRQAVHAFLITLTERSDVVSVLLLEHRSLQAEFRARHVARRDRFELLWRELIQEGVDTKKFCVTDVSMSVRALLGVMNWIITWYKPSGNLGIEQIADQIADLFLYGLICRPNNSDNSISILKN